MIYLLHISDLHLFNDPNWKNMSAAILNNVENTLKGAGITDRLLVVTGDFHQYSVPDYELAKEFLVTLIEKMKLEPEHDVFFIPGNHDVSPSANNDLNRMNAIDLINVNSNVFSRNRENLQSDAYYKEYLKFVEEMGVYTKDEVRSSIPIKTHMRTWRNRLHLLHLNTTLVANGKSKRNQYTDTYIATEITNKGALFKGEIPSLCLGHNSFYDINENQRNQLAAAFANGYISAYLSGDKHCRIRKREEKEILLGGDYGNIRNFVCYRSSTDEGDDYSDFGMIWHLIDENRWNANAQFLHWDINDQAKMYGDEEYSYTIRHKKEENSNTDDHDEETMRINHHWLTTDMICDRIKKDVKEIHITNFLLGRNSGRTYWNVIASNKIVRREIVTTLLNYVENPGIYVLTGAGGEGKTTVLMQLGKELVYKGKKVFFCNGYKPLPLPDSLSIQKGSIFLLDNALGTLSFIRLLEKIQNLVENSDVSFVFAARENEWNIMVSNTPEYRNFYSNTVNNIQMGAITEKEALRFAKCIKKNLPISKDEGQIKEIFQKNSYGFLYASMLLSVSEKNTLDEIAKDVLDHLQEKSFDALLILALTVISEHCGTEFSKEVFKEYCNKNHLKERYIRSSLSKELVENVGKFQTRHPVISELFYREILELLSQDELNGVIEESVLLRLELFSQLTGYSRWSLWTGINSVIQIVSLASTDSQEHIFSRLLDETQSNGPTDFDSIYSRVENRESQSLFIRLCYDRDRLSAHNLKSWTQQEVNKQLWSYELPYSAAWMYKKISDKLVGTEDRFWMDWAAFEKQERGLGKYDQENSTRWILRKACIERKSDSTLWSLWGRLEAENGNVGAYDLENSARWIYRKACMEHDVDSRVWLSWGRLEAENGNMGAYELENSARWIFRKVCMEHDVDRWIWSSWLSWGRLEEENGKVGDYDQENSARWIFRYACMEKDVHSNVWLSWGRLEVENGNVGAYDLENSARWIYRKVCMEKDADSNVWASWGKLEAENGNVGAYDLENSARWIYRKVCMEKDADGSVWSSWERLETENGNIGTYELENSARWICRKACIDHDADSSVWLSWGKLEAENGNVGAYDLENSTRWIYRKACIEHDADSRVWLLWGKLEAENGNVGAYELENSARWIYRKACMEKDADSSVWLSWGRLEVENGNVGTYELENSARWIFRRACMEYDVHGPVWLSWGRLEAENGNVGAYDLENSARWIYYEACINHRYSVHTIWRAWSRLEADQGNIGENNEKYSAAWILSTGIKRKTDNYQYLISALVMLEVSRGSIENARKVLRLYYKIDGIVCGLFAIIIIICGAKEKDPPLEDLIEFLQNQQKQNLSAKNYLYHCYRLEGKNILAEKAKDGLRSHHKYKASNEDNSNNYINAFIDLCRLAKEGKSSTDMERIKDIVFADEEIQI